MEIDFGGIGKEYAADRVATICIEHGIAHGLVNLGGDVRAIGPQAGRRAVARRHPPSARATDEAIAGFDLADGAVATSGDYERFFELDGRRYCHILDPRTGMPVAHWQSVSVVAPLCVVAGSCATIAMLLERAAPPRSSTRRRCAGWASPPTVSPTATPARPRRARRPEQGRRPDRTRIGGLAKRRWPSRWPGSDSGRAGTRGRTGRRPPRREAVAGVPGETLRRIQSGAQKPTPSAPLPSGWKFCPEHQAAHGRVVGIAVVRRAGLAAIVKPVDRLRARGTGARIGGFGNEEHVALVLPVLVVEHRFAAGAARRVEVRTLGRECLGEEAADGDGPGAFVLVGLERAAGRRPAVELAGVEQFDLGGAGGDEVMAECRVEVLLDRHRRAGGRRRGRAAFARHRDPHRAAGAAAVDDADGATAGADVGGSERDVDGAGAAHRDAAGAGGRRDPEFAVGRRHAGDVHGRGPGVGGGHALRGAGGGYRLRTERQGRGRQRELAAGGRAARVVGPDVGGDRLQRGVRNRTQRRLHVRPRHAPDQCSTLSPLRENRSGVVELT